MKIGAFSSEELSEPLFNLSCRMLSWLLDESLSPNSFFLVSCSKANEFWLRSLFLRLMSSWSFVPVLFYLATTTSPSYRLIWGCNFWKLRIRF